MVLVKQSCALGGVCTIGDIGPGGGVVFYDAGSLQPWGRYLEAAPVTWNGGTRDPEAEWGCMDSSRIGFPGEAISAGVLATHIGTGAANTAAIVARCPESGIAAKLADALIFGGKSDWFLPSKDELNLIYHNIYLKLSSRDRLFNISFASDWYWSSSEAEYNVSSRFATAWLQGFWGQQGKNLKGFPNHVRPVRAF